MTDDEMDARLTAAGAAWRAATDPPTFTAPTDQPDALLSPAARPRRSGHRFALLASAAVVAAALVVGGLFALRGTGDGNRSADQAVALEGTVWKLLGYDDHSFPDSTSTLYIGKGGALVADDTCNLLTGKVEIDGNHFSVDDLDRRFYNCTDSVGEVTFDRGVEVL